MIGLIAPGFLGLTVAVVAGFRRFRPSFQAFWFVLASGAVAAWVSILLLRLLLPPAAERVYWTMGGVFEGRLGFGWDLLSWNASFALLTMLTAGVLTDVVSDSVPEWLPRTLSFIIGTLALVAALAANLYTFLVAATLLDLALLVLYLNLSADPGTVRRAMLGFSVRFAGSGLLLLAAVLSNSVAEPALNTAVLSGWFVVAGGIARLGLIPDRGATFEHEGRNRQLGGFAQLAVFLTGLVFILRTLSSTGMAAAFEGPGGLVPLMLLVAWSSIAALSWLTLRSTWLDSSALLAAAAGLVVASELRLLPAAGAAWGWSWLLAAGLLSCLRHGGRLAISIGILSLWTVSMLPFSAVWDGGSLFSLPISPLLLLIPVQAVLLAGLFRRLLLVDGAAGESEPWIRVLYPIALAIHPAAALFIAWLPWQGLDWIGANPWWPGFAATALAGLVWWRLSEREAGLDLSRLRRTPKAAAQFFRPVVASIYAAVERSARVLTAVLEGEGGVLWALLAMTLILSILSQLVNRGG